MVEVYTTVGFKSINPETKQVLREESSENCQDRTGDESESLSVQKDARDFAMALNAFATVFYKGEAQYINLFLQSLKQQITEHCELPPSEGEA